MRYVLIIVIGPIQDFIAAARRCRDLWYGSWLLSDLSKATALGVAIKIGQKNLVFPSPESELYEAADNEKETSVANKIVAIVPDGEDPKVVAEAAEKNMRERLICRSRVVFEAVERGEKAFGQKGSFQREMAEQQLEDLIEFLWVAVPIEETGDDRSYAEAREKAESLLAQRKRTMLWDAVPWEAKSGVPKSSLDGQRESVIDDAPLPKRRPNEEWPPEVVTYLKKTFGVKPNERLCGVGLLKRLGKRPRDDDKHQFLSTPHMATMPLLQRMANEALKNDEVLRFAWNQYLEKLRGYGADLMETAAKPHVVLGHYDGMLLIDTRLEEWFAHFEEVVRKQKLQCAQAALRTFFDETNLPRPMPYFAVLLADGDNMGKAISARENEEQHRNLSLALDQFAQYARCIVETQYRGELIYSGGDDVLAFVPLNNVIECASELAKDFESKLKEFAVQGMPVPTLSVGVAICHFIEPMGHALDMARKAEKRAKIEKNSLAFFVDKRSGPPVEVVSKWTFEVDGKTKPFDEQLLHLVALHRHDAISDGLAHELLELETLRVRVDKQNEQAIESLIVAETKRILKRKRAEGGKVKVDPEVIKTLLKTPQQLAERLLVTRLIAQAKDIAEGKPKQDKRTEDKSTEAT